MLDLPNMDNPMSAVDIDRQCDRMIKILEQIKEKNEKAARNGNRGSCYFDFAELHSMAGHMCKWINKENV